MMSLLSSIFGWGIVGASVALVQKSMQDIDKQSQNIHIQHIASHSSELFQAICDLNKLCSASQDLQAAFGDLTHNLNKLLLLEKHLKELPKMRKWTTEAVRYKRNILSTLKYVKISLVSRSELEPLLAVIREVANNTAHNIRLDNAILYE